MRKINIQYAKPDMTLARDIITDTGIILLVRGIALSQNLINKLATLHITTIFVEDPLYEGIIAPEYISLELQQQALSVLSTVLQTLKNKGTLNVQPVIQLSTQIVEELMCNPKTSICLNEIMTHDDPTFSHSLNCAIYAILLGQFNGLNYPDLKELAAGALLHDIGKNDISTTLLNKPDKLSADEFELIKKHAQWGFEKLIVLHWDLSSLVAHMAWQHHEKMDGSGYPRGIGGNDILFHARIVSIADVYEALTANRPYRPALSPKKAHDIIQAGLGTHFDDELGKLFLSKVALYSPGTLVTINTGETALIVSIPPNNPKYPVIRIIKEPDGQPCKPYEIHLEEHPQIHIINSQ
ncbi:HD-GYP domain-containing protein (c-di-GMP phosphodiesterase class II) [Sporomusaceae bacterium BoRhaA]|uniref:HD-GYP domain-containing protein n=1 Tax=Pelorhabdus rhamnosifermentans TaxID=2772457 RepID=UPI001C0632E3|nr:HD-GYP domain-containing protein [Pelorhabdus rhamnosifermentans]MBU2702840.1 HD-GYP domain-containing protein (c-di-GMP phosphodiesterase class II) [Pelorhabdus rhamnosifermentans]